MITFLVGVHQNVSLMKQRPCLACLLLYHQCLLELLSSFSINIYWVNERGRGKLAGGQSMSFDFLISAWKRMYFHMIRLAKTLPRVWSHKKNLENNSKIHLLIWKITEILYLFGGHSSPFVYSGNLKHIDDLAVW